MGCNAVGRVRLIVSNGWKYFSLNYCRKEGKTTAVVPTHRNSILYQGQAISERYYGGG